VGNGPPPTDGARGSVFYPDSSLGGIHTTVVAARPPAEPPGGSQRADSRPRRSRPPIPTFDDHDGAFRGCLPGRWVVRQAPISTALGPALPPLDRPVLGIPTVLVPPRFWPPSISLIRIRPPLGPPANPWSRAALECTFGWAKRKHSGAPVPPPPPEPPIPAPVAIFDFWAPGCFFDSSGFVFFSARPSWESSTALPTVIGHLFGTCKK